MARHDAQYVPAFKTQIVPCEVCNAGIEVGGKRTRPARCTECAIKAYRSAMIQIVRKSGPSYEKWRRGIAASVGAQIGGDTTQ